MDDSIYYFTKLAPPPVFWPQPFFQCRLEHAILKISVFRLIV